MEMRDNKGNLLNDGDWVTVIKDLRMKGASVTQMRPAQAPLSGQFSVLLLYYIVLADRVRFELTEPLRVHCFSRAAP